MIVQSRRGGSCSPGPTVDKHGVSPELDDRERRALRLKARTATLAALRGLGGEAARDEILAIALADGGFTARELTASPPPARAVKFARMVDYQLSWTLTNLKRDGLVENPVRGVWRLTGAALEAPQPAVEEPIYVDRLEELRRMSYREYLRTPEWRTTRAAALLRAGYGCSLDVTHTTDLEVHHRTYERRGEELASDLVVLCHDCHMAFHKTDGHAPRTPSGPAPRATAADPASRPPRTEPGDQRRPQVEAMTTMHVRTRPSAKRSLLRRILTP